MESKQKAIMYVLIGLIIGIAVSAVGVMVLRSRALSDTAAKNAAQAGADTDNTEKKTNNKKGEKRSESELSVERTYEYGTLTLTYYDSAHQKVKEEAYGCDFYSGKRYISLSEFDEYGNEISYTDGRTGYVTEYEYEYEKDSDGTLVKARQYEAGQLTEEFFYDEDGKRIKSTEYGESDGGDDYITYTEYDEAERPVKETIYKGDPESLLYSVSYSYYENGLMKVREDNWPDGSIFTNKYEYDDDGYLEKAVFETDWSKTETYYDKNGSITEEIEYWDGKIESHDRYDVNESDGTYRKKTTYDSSRTLTETDIYEMNEDNNLLTITKYDAAGNKTGSEVHMYNDRGLETKWISYDQNGKETQNYDFDEYGYIIIEEYEPPES